jgi:hypothetical protein
LLFERLETETDDALNVLGQRGREYAHAHADWDSVIPLYESVLELQAPSPESINMGLNRGLTAIHQLLPDVTHGDAISSHAFAIRDQLRQFGYSSDIFCKRRDDRLAGETFYLMKFSRIRVRRSFTIMGSVPMLRQLRLLTPDPRRSFITMSRRQVTSPGIDQVFPGCWKWDASV